MTEFKFKNSKTYRKILEHRNNCPKWGKEFCLECFGKGLVKTFSDFEDEFIKYWKKEKEMDEKLAKSSGDKE